MEIWKEIKGFKDYEISNLGNVKSLSRFDSLGRYVKEKILKPTINSNGYLIVTLCNNSKSTNKKVHQLVAELFLNHVFDGTNKLVVNHINLNKTDNRVENLEIITNRENSNKKHIKSTSKYVGVRWSTNRNKWRASIQINGKSKNLGSFINEIEAHNAYQNALSNL